MASVNEARPNITGATKRSDAYVEQWIFVFVAGLMFATALAGFVPDSFKRLAAIGAGERAPFSIWVHFHAVAMGAWLSLVLAQSVLVATGNARHHRKLGTASFVLVPVVLLSMVLVATVRYGQVWDAFAAAPPETQAKAAKALAGSNNLLLSQLRSGVLFALFMVLALRARKADSGFHKRMILLATMVLMNAAVNRVPGLPSTMPGSPLSLDLWGLVLVLPVLVWDALRLGRMHRAFVIGFAIWLPASIGVQLAWGTEWWQALVPRIFGYA